MKNQLNVVFVALICILSSCAQEQGDRLPDNVPRLMAIDDSSIKSAVFDNPGWVVVLFNNDEHWQCNDMLERMTFFADRYGKTIRFCSFNWDVKKDPQAYRLEMLPTVILYHQGREVDRIRGIPERTEDRVKWNNDLNLWLLKNALEAKGDPLSGSYLYRFNNTSELEIKNL
jgi:hypothetical protein